MQAPPAPNVLEPGAGLRLPSGPRKKADLQPNKDSKHRGLRDSDVYFLSSNISGADGPRPGEPFCCPCRRPITLRTSASSVFQHFAARFIVVRTGDIDGIEGEAWRRGAAPVRGHGAGPWGTEPPPGLVSSSAHAPSVLHRCASRPQVPKRTVLSQEEEHRPGFRS